MRACKDTHLAAAFEDEKAIALGEISRTERELLHGATERGGKEIPGGVQSRIWK